MDVVCFGQQNWDVCWTGKQHLMTRLAQRGHRVLYVDPVPVIESHKPPASRRLWRTEVLSDRLWRFSMTRYSSAAGQCEALRAAAKDLFIRRPVAIVMRPMPADLRDAVRPAARIYYAVDEWTAFGGLSAAEKPRLRAMEEELLRTSQVALGVSPRLVRRFNQHCRHAYMQENGVDAAFYAPRRLEHTPPHPQLAHLPRPRLGFIGQVDERMDQALLLELARMRPQWQIVLAGRVRVGVDVSSLAEQPSVHLLGYQPYAALPSAAREFDVCIVPYRSSSLTESCNPLKVYEYLATGRPVVSAPLEGLGAARAAVRLASGAAQWVEQVEAALAHPNAGQPQRLALAQQCDWDRRTDELERRMNEALARGTPGTPGTPGIEARGDDDGEPHFVTAAQAAAVLHLDAKDDAERQVNDGFARLDLTRSQRLLFHVLCALGKAAHLGRVIRRWLGGTQPLDVQRIFIVRSPVYVGDLLALAPMLAVLRRRWPTAHITLGTQRDARAVAMLDGSGLVDEVRALDFCDAPERAQRVRGMWRLFREGYDLLITGAWFFVRPEGYFCGAPYRIGLYDGHVLQRLCNGLVPLDANRHEADNNLALAEALGCQISAADRSAALGLDAQETWRAGRELLRVLDVPRGADVITVHPGSKRHSRRWPPDRFAATLARLLDERPALHAVITGVTDEHDLAEAIIAALSPEQRLRVHIAAGRTDMLALAGLLDLSALVISNDTGVMHFARARGATLLALMGPENERRWGPTTDAAGAGGNVIVLRHEVPCAPCFRETCEGHYCMRALSVQQVHDAANRLLNGHGKDAAREAGQNHARQHRPGEYEINKRRWSWNGLDDAGMALPEVTAVVIVGEGDYRPALAAARRQDYPRLHIVLVLDPSIPPNLRPSDREEVALFGEGVQIVTAGAKDGSAKLWMQLRPLVRGELVAVMLPGDAGDDGRIGRDVASLLRSINVAAVQAGRLMTRFDPADPATVAQPMTFRSALLAPSNYPQPAAV